MPAADSSESMFCVKQRSSSPFSWSSRTNACVGVGRYCPGHISRASW
jgi:hypothetical protein